MDGSEREEPAGSWLARVRDRDHTRGSLLRSVLTLSLPSIATSLVGAGAYQLGDLWLLQRLGTEAVAAATASQQTLRQLVFLVVLGMQTSAQMFVARLSGQRRIAEAEHLAGQALVLGLGLWIATGAVGIACADPLARLLASDPATIEAIALFTRISFLTLIGPIWLQLGSAVLNGAGDTTTPMLASFVMTPVMLLAEWALGFGELGCPRLGLAGIAWGGGLGGLVGAGMIVGALLRGSGRVRLRAAQLVPERRALGQLLSAAWQPGLHMLARTSILFFFTWLAGRLGPDVLAAYGIGVRIEMMAIMIAFPIANACATLVGQNLGANRPERVWRSIHLSLATECAALWPTALALFTWRETFAAYFAPSPAVSELAAEYLGYTAVVLAFYGLYFVAFRSLQAAGDLRTPMWTSVTLAFGIGIPLALLLSRRLDFGATGMWIANLIYALLNCAAMMIWLLRGRWLRPAHSLRAGGAIDPHSGIAET